jgi:hypothetical protein
MLSKKAAGQDMETPVVPDGSMVRRRAQVAER